LQRPQVKGAVREAKSAYHTRWNQDDRDRCLSLGSAPFWSACADCSALCPLRAASPGAGLPGIGISSDTSRKNGWHLAEHAREARPDGMQRLLAHAVWDTEGTPLVFSKYSRVYQRIPLFATQAYLPDALLTAALQMRESILPVNSSWNIVILL
jgi:hypothetical protein